MDGEVTPKLLAGTAIKIRVAAACMVLLGLGAWLTPPAAQSTIAPAQEHAAPLLEAQVQLRDSARPFRGVVEAAAPLLRYAAAVVPPPLPDAVNRDYDALPRASLPDGFAVRVSETEWLTHARALDGRPLVRLRDAAGVERDATLTAFDRRTGLALLQTDAAAGTAPRLATDLPAAGALAVATGAWEARDIVVPAFVTSAGGGRYTLAPAAGTLVPGMPVFSLGGELVAVAAGDAQGQAFDASQAVAGLRARRSAGQSEASFGMAYQAVPASLRPVFGEQGVLVTHVLRGAPADTGGLVAGDVMTRIGDTEITDLPAATRLLGEAAPDTAVALTVRRNGRFRTLTVTPTTPFAVAALDRADDLAGRDAHDVLSPDQMTAAGIPRGASILAVNGQPVTSRADVDRARRRSRTPVPVLVRHGSTRFFVALDASR